VQIGSQAESLRHRLFETTYAADFQPAGSLRPFTQGVALG